MVPLPGPRPGPGPTAGPRTGPGGVGSHRSPEPGTTGCPPPSRPRRGPRHRRPRTRGRRSWRREGPLAPAAPARRWSAGRGRRACAGRLRPSGRSRSSARACPPSWPGGSTSRHRCVHQRQDLARIDLQADIAQHGDAPVPRGQSADPDPAGLRIVAHRGRRARSWIDGCGQGAQAGAQRARGATGVAHGQRQRIPAGQPAQFDHRRSHRGPGHHQGGLSGANPPVGDDQHLVGVLDHPFEAVLGQDDGDAQVVHEALQGCEDLLGGARVQGRRRLVEDEDPGVAGQRRADRARAGARRPESGGRGGAGRPRRGGRASPPPGGAWCPARCPGTPSRTPSRARPSSTTNPPSGLVHHADHVGEVAWWVGGGHDRRRSPGPKRSRRCSAGPGR